MLWAISKFLLPSPHLETLVVSEVAAIGSATTLLVAVGVLLLQTKIKQLKVSSLIVVTSLSVSLLLSISSTGHMSSPYLPLWVLMALFVAVSGMAAFIPISIGAALYALFLLIDQSLSVADWIMFVLAVPVPVLVALFIWVRRFQIQTSSNQTVTELASELHQESSKTSIIINAIADGVLLIDKNGIVQLINPAAEQIIGWGNKDAINLDYRSVLKIIDSKDAIVERELDPVGQCISTHQSVITDKFGIRTISGKQLLASIMVSPLQDVEAGVIVVFRDITSQRAEERDQAEFISTASHEMRTPVAAIEGYLGLALNPQTATIDDKARTYLLKAHESAGNLGRLFQDLLDVSKVDDGRLSNNLAIVDVGPVVRNLLDDFVGQLTEKSLDLIFAPDTRAAGQNILPIFYSNIDTVHFKEILSNLISNAIKYTKEGHVTVDITGDNDHVYVSVSDTGLGIPAEDIPHLFQKFYRVDNTDTREIGGTGLGLYLSRRLAESMRGRLTLSSVYGKGSTFTVELPRVSPEEAAAKASTPLNTVPITSK